MSTDQSNNNMSESSEESTPSMETVDFFQYIIDSTRDRHSQNNMSNLNLINSFLNRMDSAYDNSTDIETALPINSIPPPPPMQWTNNILSSLTTELPDLSNNNNSNENNNRKTIYQII